MSKPSLQDLVQQLRQEGRIVQRPPCEEDYEKLMASCRIAIARNNRIIQSMDEIDSRYDGYGTLPTNGIDHYAVKYRK